MAVSPRVIGALGVILTGASLAVAAQAGAGMRGVALLNALSVALPFGVGLYAWSRAPTERFGRLLVVLGAAWFGLTLAASRDEVVYSVGRVAAFLVVPLLVYVILAFPGGRLDTRPARAIVLAAVGVAGLLYLPLVPLMQSFPVPYPWGGCDLDCPANAFFVGHQPGFVSAAEAARELLAGMLFGASVLVIAGRIKRATPLRRRMLVPLLAAAAVCLLAVIGLFVGRRAGVDALEDVAGWALLTSAPMISVGLLIGMLLWRTYAGSALARLVRRLAEFPPPAELRWAISDALADPSLRVYYWVPQEDGYADADGRRVQLAPGDPAQAVTPVVGDGGPIAAIAHDRALLQQPELLEAVSSVARIALDHHRLQVELRASVRRVRESQTRILAAADDERERIERDIHDGAQQHLIAIRMKLELINEMTKRRNPGAAELQRGLADDLDAAIEEIRDLARGIYPPLLASQGLRDALEAVALRSPVPTTVDVVARRFPREMESTIYFCCREALQNVAKHATGARRAWISVSCDEQTLWFAVSDDGGGFDTDAAAEGTGLVNMRDRLAVVGGETVLRSRRGAGTTVMGSIPLG